MGMLDARAIFLFQKRKWVSHLIMIEEKQVPALNEVGYPALFQQDSAPLESVTGDMGLFLEVPEIYTYYKFS